MIFKREERYIVLKIKDFSILPERIQTKLEDLLDEIAYYDLPFRKYVVVESDWPEYEVVWKMIEERCNDPKQ